MLRVISCAAGGSVVAMARGLKAEPAERTALQRAAQAHRGLVAAEPADAEQLEQLQAPEEPTPHQIAARRQSRGKKGRFA